MQCTLFFVCSLRFFFLWLFQIHRKREILKHYCSHLLLVWFATVHLSKTFFLVWRIEMDQSLGSSSRPRPKFRLEVIKPKARTRLGLLLPKARLNFLCGNWFLLLNFWFSCKMASIEVKSTFSRLEQASAQDPKSRSRLELVARRPISIDEKFYFWKVTRNVFFCYTSDPTLTLFFFRQTDNFPFNCLLVRRSIFVKKLVLFLK